MASKILISILSLHDPDLLLHQPAKLKPASINSSIQAFRDLGVCAVCVLPFSQLPVGFRARLNGRFEPGALNAGRAWIAGGLVDGFGQSLFFQFSGVCASRAFLFLSVSGDLRANASIGRKVPSNFYNLKNIAPAGSLGRGGDEGGDAPEYSSYKKSFTLVR
jgi:hypothetical protein